MSENGRNDKGDLRRKLCSLVKVVVFGAVVALPLIIAMALLGVKVASMVSGWLS